jgi:hypothetical protein
VTPQISDALLRAQNPDGGWGAAPGGRSNTEATSLAILALHALADKRNLAAARGAEWLRSLQKDDGSWPQSRQVHEGRWVTALAVLALAPFESHRPSALKGAEWLLQLEGSGLGIVASLLYRFAPEQVAVKLNPSLKGWPWTKNTFSWVEPTAYALLALKRLRPNLLERQKEVDERIRQGERMLYDRMCEGGGWNYGNSEVFGEKLWPYPDTTAVALLALQDRAREKANQLSLEALERMLAENPSRLALAWSIICFSVYGRESRRWRDLLLELYRDGMAPETKTLGLTLVALGPGIQSFKL